MYWKKFLISFLFFMIIFSGKVSAEEYQVFSGHVPEEYMEIMNNIDIPFGADYILYASGAEEYTLIVGDLNVEGATITSISECDMYIISSDYTVLHDTVSDLLLNCGDYIVYSNIGDYPLMYERGEIYEGTTLFVICIGFCFVLIMCIFKRICSR